jgi:CDI immunity proteins
MKLNFDTTIEELEGKKYLMPPDVTGLITTIYRLRKKPLRDYSVEDLRISIGQNIALPHLIPLAIKKLKEDILSEGNLYEGDLLKNVLTADISFWTTNKEYWTIVKELYNRNKEIFDSDNTYRQIRKSFEQFVLIHEQN